MEYPRLLWIFTPVDCSHLVDIIVMAIVSTIMVTSKNNKLLMKCSRYAGFYVVSFKVNNKWINVSDVNRMKAIELAILYVQDTM